MAIRLDNLHMAQMGKKKIIMKKFKTYGALFLAMANCFTLGLYAASQFKYNEPIETYRWLVTSLFGVMFLLLFFKDYSELD